MYNNSLEEVLEWLDELMDLYADILPRIAQVNDLPVEKLVLALNDAPYHLPPVMYLGRNDKPHTLELYEYSSSKSLECEVEAYEGDINSNLKDHPEYLQPIKERFAAECERIGVRCLQ